MTAAEDDKIIPRNPCQIKGAGDEKAPERPVLTVAQAFALAERIGRRPVGNIWQLPAGGYRLRFGRDGIMHASPEVFDTRAAAEWALWKLADEGRADFRHDRRFSAFVLVATFASLRWGEAIALRRGDLDLEAGSVRVRAAYVERSTGEILLGPPKPRAGRRVVGIPAVIIPELRDHLAVFVQAEADALVFPGPKGGPMRRSNFNKLSGWPHAVRSTGAEGLHVHDLRHTGNTFAASSGAGLRDLMVRMGHDSERAALIHQHEARGADQRITGAIDAHVQAEKAKNSSDGADPGAAELAG
jgi:integrase